MFMACNLNIKVKIPTCCICTTARSCPAHPSMPPMLDTTEAHYHTIPHLHANGHRALNIHTPSNTTSSSFSLTQRIMCHTFKHSYIETHSVQPHLHAHGHREPCFLCSSLKRLRLQLQGTKQHQQDHSQHMTNVTSPMPKWRCVYQHCSHPPPCLLAAASNASGFNCRAQQQTQQPRETHMPGRMQRHLRCP
jgi:hypothetical protein